MEISTRCRILILFITIAAVMLSHCDARRSVKISKEPSEQTSLIIKHIKKLVVTSKIMDLLIDQTKDDASSNSQPYVSPPFSLAPFESLGPMSLPENSPPYCVNPPTTIPSPAGITTSPPSPFDNLSPPVFPNQSPPNPLSNEPSPPSPIGGSVPSPLSNEPGPPAFDFPNSPGPLTPSPPSDIPSPSSFTPSPTTFQPPIVLPPPIGPPSDTAPKAAMWCVAKPQISGPILQQALNYACGSGADCDSILPNGKCYEPNSLYAHASYAFNSYWQKTKAAGGTCDFGGTAALVTVDPSSNGCRFETY